MSKQRSSQKGSSEQVDVSFKDIAALKEQVFEEYSDYSLQKLYNFNELLIDTIHQLQFKQMAVQELITDRLDNICPKEKTN